MVFLAHLVSRGLAMDHSSAMSSAMSFVKRDGGQGGTTEIPKLYSVLAFGTLFFAFLCITFVDYSLSQVVQTLAMVETPSSVLTVRPSDNPDAQAKEHLLETGPQITLATQKPITSSMFGTLRHVVSQGGFFARWRAMRSYYIYGIMFTVTVNFLALAIPRPSSTVGSLLGQILISGIAGALTSPLHAIWCHKVIAMPSNKSMYERLLPKADWKRIALPAALKSSATSIAVAVGLGIGYVLHLERAFQPEVPTKGHLASAISLTLLTLAITMGCWAFIVLPAQVALLRIEASMLPDDQETIVPFDRTFGGKVESKMLGGTGAIGFKDAWKSVDWEARRRVFSLYAKTIGIFMLMVVGLFVVIICEALAVYAFQRPQEVNL